MKLIIKVQNDQQSLHVQCFNFQKLYFSGVYHLFTFTPALHSEIYYSTQILTENYFTGAIL